MQDSYSEAEAKRSFRTHKHRKCRGDGMCFYINRFDRHLDRMGGGGDPKLFHKITFADVMRFVKFDLEANDLFLLGPAPWCCHWWHLFCTPGMCLLHSA